MSAHDAGLRAGMEKVATRLKVKRLPLPVKRRAPRPSRELGLGSRGLGTMRVDDMRLRARRLQQPARPPRY